jgi:hypothetical protein
VSAGLLVAWVGAIGRPHSDRDAHVGEWRVLFIPDDFVRGAWSIVRLALTPPVLLRLEQCSVAMGKEFRSALLDAGISAQRECRR